MAEAVLDPNQQLRSVLDKRLLCLLYTSLLTKKREFILSLARNSVAAGYDFGHGDHRHPELRLDACQFALRVHVGVLMGPYKAD